MNREGKLHLICHLYPVFMVCHMQFLDWSPINLALWNIVPVACVVILLQAWMNSSNIRLCDREKRSLYVFIWFFIVIHVYYAICGFIGESTAGKLWILKHNLFLFYFAIFISLFYIIYYLVNRKRN